MAISVLVGCGTVSPDIVKDHHASPDSSTPSQYPTFSSGFLGWAGNGGSIITPNARNVYNALIAKYKLQFKEEFQVSLNNDAGVEPYLDRFGNRLFTIDLQHLNYFIRLKDWNKNKRDSDAIWMKLKHKISP